MNGGSLTLTPSGQIKRTERDRLLHQGIKYCARCKQVKPLEEFTVNSRSKTGRERYCRSCMSVYVTPKATKKITKQYVVRKIRFAALLGGRCVRCGYNEYASGLHFHHVDREKKTALISRLFHPGYGFTDDQIISELSKCALLCANCHNALHAHEWTAKWVLRTDGIGYTIRR